MRKAITATLVSGVMLSLVGCAGMSNSDVGALSGAAIGGAVGSLFGSGSGQIVSAIAGTAIGAYIGGKIGQTMDRQDQMRMSQAVVNTPVDHVTHWRNKKSGNEYYTKPTRVYRRNDQPCKDYTTTAIIGGKRETIYGHACRMADGTWKVTG